MFKEFRVLESLQLKLVEEQNEGCVASVFTGDVTFSSKFTFERVGKQVKAMFLIMIIDIYVLFSIYNKI